MAGLVVVAVNRMPAAEVEVSADLVRRLLADQHPDLARLPVEFLANGWDNELYRVGDGLIARLPRRALGAEIIKNEQRWLPGLAPRLPLPIPYPERTGVPAHGYPYCWSVVPYLPGVPAAQASSFDPAAAAAALGGFLGALHVPDPVELVVPAVREELHRQVREVRVLTGEQPPHEVRRHLNLGGRHPVHSHND
jgi:aminoglycoside phosphotransferase (APT) family kinase protein